MVSPSPTCYVGLTVWSLCEVLRSAALHRGPMTKSGTHNAAGGRATTPEGLNTGIPHVSHVGWMPSSKPTPVKRVEEKPGIVMGRTAVFVTNYYLRSNRPIIICLYLFNISVWRKFKIRRCKLLKLTLKTVGKPIFAELTISCFLIEIAYILSLFRLKVGFCSCRNPFGCSRKIFCSVGCTYYYMPSSERLKSAFFPLCSSRFWLFACKIMCCAAML